MKAKKKAVQVTLPLSKIIPLLIKEGILNEGDEITNILYPDPEKKIRIFCKREISPRILFPKKRVEIPIAQKSDLEKQLFLNTLIDNLELSPRVYNQLKHSFFDAESLVKTTEKHLRKYRGIGDGAINEIRQILAQNGYDLKEK